MPNAPRRGGGRLRGALAGGNARRITFAVVALIVIALAFSMRSIATFWTDYLWFQNLSLGDVWKRLLSAKLTISFITGLVLFVLIFVNLLIADRIAPRFPVGVSPDDEVLARYRELVSGRRRLVWFTLALGISLVPAVSAVAQWQNWVLYWNSGEFGVNDLHFGRDIGFFVFKLPLLSAATDWLLGFLLLTILITTVIHYLNGAIRIGVPAQKVSVNAKAHISVLLALAAFVKAIDYWLERSRLVLSDGSSFDGAGYTDIHATLPAIQLMILISVFAGIVLLVNIRREGWSIPAITVGLWALLAVVTGGVYPAFVQSFQVNPSELSREKPYVQRNIAATRQALGLVGVKNVAFEYESGLGEKSLEEGAVNLDNARLLDPTVVKPTIQDLQVAREYYQFVDVDVDRYQVDDTRTPVVISARELNIGGISRRTWEKEHLVFTHGYGAALAPANSVNSRGEPRFLVSGIPPETNKLPELKRPEIYVGESMSGYAIVGTKMRELSTDNLSTTYEGDGGVRLGSIFKRAAFALRFGHIEPLISGNITERSQVIYTRDVLERVKQVVPYLKADPDPYPVLIDGRVKYVVDLYTTSDSYPYAQSINAAEVDPSARGSFNYIRNSAKAVVDAYDGTVKLYLADELSGAEDPIIRAYARAFPGLFEEQIPSDLSAHFRYPEFLFKVQTQAWGDYHQSDPATFFTNSDRWVVAPQPSDTGTGTATAEVNSTPGQITTARSDAIEPYYQELKIGTAKGSQFVLTRPFVLTSGDGVGRNLTSVMIARMDPEHYGELEQITMVSKGRKGQERNNSVDGPVQANRKMVTYVPVTEFQTLTGQQGSRIRYGNILILPLGNSLMYMRPIYVAQEGSSRFTLKKVVLISGDAVGFGDTIDSALDDLMDSNPDGRAEGEDVADTEGGEETVPPVVEPDSGSTADPGDTTEPQSVEELLAAADAKFTLADQRLKESDLAGYSKAIEEARVLMDMARRSLDAKGSNTMGSTTTTKVPATTTTTTSKPTG